MICLGIDTSNYTSSAALYNSENGELIQARQLLPVKEGELGLRQSDAVFKHVGILPNMLESIFANKQYHIDVFGVSVSPRDEKNSYMPCFTVGKGFADSLAVVTNSKVKYFSHQAGHIAAALYSANRFDLFEKEFIAFHVSGGTTEVVKVTPDVKKIIKTQKIMGSLDLKAGQAIDRVGSLLGLSFPAGVELDKLSLVSEKTYKIKPYFKDGNCSLSGLQNKCEQMYSKNENKEDIAKYCVDFISEALFQMTRYALEKYPNLPIVYSGGVMSNTLIRKRFAESFDAVFAGEGFSSDNAAGIAVLASL